MRRAVCVLVCLTLCCLPLACAFGLEAGDTVVFGQYPQSDPSGYSLEPIRWLVLGTDGDMALLISQTALDVMKWHYMDRETSWEECTLRAWLNGYEKDAAHPTTNPYETSFLDTAFDEKERGAILPSQLRKARGGVETTDQVFLLSLEEIRTHLPDQADRVCLNTAYTYAKNALELKGACQWWLRSLGNHAYDAAYVSYSGQLRTGGFKVHGKGMAVRPAIRISITKAEECLQ